MNLYPLSTRELLALDADEIGCLTLDEAEDLYQILRDRIENVDDTETWDSELLLALFDQQAAVLTLLRSHDSTWRIGFCACGAKLPNGWTTECGGCTEVF